MRYRVRLDFLDASSFSVNSIYEAMVFFVGPPAGVSKEREAKRAFMQVCLPTDVFWRTKGIVLSHHDRHYGVSFPKGFPCCHISGPFLCS